MSESLIGFRHAMHVVFLLDCSAARIGRVVQFVRQFLRHALFRPGTRVLQNPANRQTGAPVVGNFHRHLIVGAADAPRFHFEQGLVRSALTSWVRVTIGFSLAAIVAVPLGVYMATFPTVSAFFRPLALVGAYVPIVVFVPLTLAWFGLSETQKVGFLFIGCFVALLPLVIKDIANVPAAYLDVAVTKGASQWQLVRHVLFPVAQADIWDHLRGVYGVGWGWIILAEVVNAERGLGYLIDISNRRGHTNAIFAIIIVIVLIAIACDQLWRLGGRALFPYANRE